MKLRQFIEQLQKLEQTFGGDLPVEVGGLPVISPAINPVIGRYAVAIYCDTNYGQLDEDES